MEDDLKPSASGFGVILTKCFWSRCFMLYFVFFCCLFICKRYCGSITSAGEERANLSAVA